VLAYIPASDIRSISSGTPSSETAASYVAALTDPAVKASRINSTTVPNGSSMPVLGSLNLIDWMTSGAPRSSLCR
jgi:hypothetical protein